MELIVKGELLEAAKSYEFEWSILTPEPVLDFKNGVGGGGDL